MDSRTLDDVSLATGRVDTSWSGTARFWGTLSGVAFAVGSVLFLIESTGLLAPQPTYAPTAAGQIADEAAYWVARFAYANQLLWIWVLGDALTFFAYLGLIPLAMAVREVVGGRRAAPKLAVGFLSVAAVFGCLSAVVTFVNVEWWRNTGWDQVPAPLMAAIGRDSEFMDDLSNRSGTAGFAVLAIGLVYLGLTCRSSARMPRWAAPVAYAGAAVLATMIVVSEIPGADTVSNGLSLVIGVVIAPILTIGVGLHVARAVQPSAVSPDLAR